MFLVNEEEEKIKPTNAKIVYIYQNGMIDEKPKQFKIMKKTQNFKKIKSALGYHHLRLFNSEGAQYFEDDLEFIKNKMFLYASKGQSFDPVSTFGEYQILKKIGEGGFGTVNLAQHRQTGQLLAIKIIKADKLGSASEIDSVFVEAETLKSLKNDNIVKVYNCLALKNMQVAILMQYLEGGQLLAYVQKQGHLDQNTSLIVFKQIVKAMSYCHANGLIHRDFTLQNLLLVGGVEQKIKIIDFGIAGTAKFLTWDDLDAGSLSYMAPECFINTQGYKVDGRIDVWSAGVILFSMLTGEFPFKGNNSLEVIESIKQGSYTIPKNIALNISQSCKDILRLCLTTNPEKRPTMQSLQRHPWISGELFELVEKKKNVENLQTIEELKEITIVIHNKNIDKKNKKPGTDRFSHKNSSSNRNYSLKKKPSLLR